MPGKRGREGEFAAPVQKKARKGFSVGPQNLPDGTYRRKVDKIRRKLVENAKIRKSYDKLKAREQNVNQEDAPREGITEEPAASATRHPERQALIDEDDDSEEQQQLITSNPTDLEKEENQAKYRRPKRPKQQPFLREQREADARRQELDKRQKERAAAQLEREKRLAERARWNRTMANARGDGKRRKLGKESTILLEKVRKMMRHEESAV